MLNIILWLGIGSALDLVLEIKPSFNLKFCKGRYLYMIIYLDYLLIICLIIFAQDVKASSIYSTISLGGIVYAAIAKVS